MEAKKLDMKVLGRLALYLLHLLATIFGVKKAGILKIIQLEPVLKYFGCFSSRFYLALQVFDVLFSVHNESAQFSFPIRFNKSVIFCCCLCILGASIKIRELDSNIVTIGVSILVVTGLVRIICTILIAFGDNLNIKERVSLLHLRPEKSSSDGVFPFFPIFITLFVSNPSASLSICTFFLLEFRSLYQSHAWPKQQYKQHLGQLC